MKTPSHFPWQRLLTCLIAFLAILIIGFVFKGWLWAFATLDPHITSGAAAITALSAFAGVMIMGIVAIQIFFITGSTKSMEAMFKFNAQTVAVSAVSSVAERRDEVLEQITHAAKPKHFDDGQI